MSNPRTCCRICFEGIEGAALGPEGTLRPATRLAPRHTGGNDDEPAEWIPICEAHVAGWYDDMRPRPSGSR